MFQKGYSQDIEKTKALSLPSMRFDSLNPRQSKTIPEKKKNREHSKSGLTLNELNYLIYNSINFINIFIKNINEI